MMDIENILKILPHRYPILLVDRITKMEHFKSIEGYKNITINEQIFLGHFPNKVIYPGVLIIEGMAQISVILAFSSTYGEKVKEMDDKIVYFMGIDKAKFRSLVVPGDRLEYKVDVLKHKNTVWVLAVNAFVDGKLVAEAELKAMLGNKNDGK